MININPAPQNPRVLCDAHQSPINLSTAYTYQSQYSNRLDLFLDLVSIGFIDYKVKDEILKKIYISQISIDAFYQKRGLGTYLIECLKQEFDCIELFSVNSGLNVFYEKNSFIVDLLKAKQKNTTNYVWSRTI
jgi:GNAT superfamily N-acetyltransferase